MPATTSAAFTALAQSMSASLLCDLGSVVGHCEGGSSRTNVLWLEEQRLCTTRGQCILAASGSSCALRCCSLHVALPLHHHLNHNNVEN